MKDMTDTDRGQDRRVEPRLLCADLTQLEWTDSAGVRQRSCANLEDISLSGACLQVDAPLAEDLPVVVRCGADRYAGTVRYCVFRDYAWFVGVQFEPGTKWNPDSFEPEHLLDPRELLEPDKPNT